MKIILDSLPFMTAFIAIITKKILVNGKNGISPTRRELLIDAVKLFVVATIAFLANISMGKQINIWSFGIDVLMLFTYLFPLLQRNYNYAERKAVIGICAMILLQFLIATVMFQRIVGVFSEGDTTLLCCFIKGITYGFVAMWCCLTSGCKEKKLKDQFVYFRSELIKLIKESKMSPSMYYLLALEALYLLLENDAYLVPACIYGLHDFLNGKKKKGVVYMVTGNLLLLLHYVHPTLKDAAVLLYTFIALIDLLVCFIKQRKIGTRSLKQA